MGRSGDLVGGYINSLEQNLWGFILKIDFSIYSEQ